MKNIQLILVMLVIAVAIHAWATGFRFHPIVVVLFGINDLLTYARERRRDGSST